MNTFGGAEPRQLAARLPSSWSRPRSVAQGRGGAEGRAYAADAGSPIQAQRVVGCSPGTSLSISSSISAGRTSRRRRSWRKWWNPTQHLALFPSSFTTARK